MNSSHSILHEGVIGIAIEPTLSRLGRSDHRMVARPRVLGRVAIRRVIAAMRCAALLTRPQMNPSRAHFHALIALPALCVLTVVMAPICEQVPSAIVIVLLLRQHLMNEGVRDRTLAPCRRDTLDIATPDIADGEHSGQTRFEKVGSPNERPVRGGQIVL